MFDYVTICSVDFDSSRQITEKPAYNGRFGASGAVARPKVCANLQVYRPSERQWTIKENVSFLQF